MGAKPRRDLVAVVLDAVEGHVAFRATPPSHRSIVRLVGILHVTFHQFFPWVCQLGPLEEMVARAEQLKVGGP